MKHCIYAAALMCCILGSNSASAQLAPEQPYAPITLDQQSYNSLVNVLSEMKYKEVAAILQYLAQLEQRARMTSRMGTPAEHDK